MDIAILIFLSSGLFLGWSLGANDAANVFSTAAYRFGHSTLSSQLLRLDENGLEVAAGHVALKNAFFKFNPVCKVVAPSSQK